MCSTLGPHRTGWTHSTLSKLKAPTCGMPKGNATLISLRRWSTPILDINTPKRSEEHTSELQSRFDLVCRLLLEKKKTKNKQKPKPAQNTAHTPPTLKQHAH